jgi:hypothetical protein
MCEPVTMATIAIGASAGGAATNIIGQNTTRQMNKGYENQKKNAQDDLIIENRKRATHDYLREVRLEQLEQSQEESSVSEQSNDIARQAEGATGQAVASAAERGVSGNNLETIISDYDFQQNKEVGLLRLNQAMANMQHTENIAGAKDQFDYRVSSVKPYVPRVQPPVDYFGPIFGAVSDSAKTVMGSPETFGMPAKR